MKANAKRQIKTAKGWIIKANEEVTIYRKIGINNVKLYQIVTKYGSFDTIEGVVNMHFKFQ
jgi:hypothetical protein